MNAESISIGGLEQIGGALCLDFVNTVGWRGRPDCNEYLNSCSDLIGWCIRNGCLTQEEGVKARYHARARTEEAEEMVQKARQLRIALYEVFSAVAQNTAPAETGLRTLNENLPPAWSRVRVESSEGGFVAAWDAGARPLGNMLGPVVLAAFDLLTSQRLSRIKECANEGCGWLFLDGSKNRSRRWCDMRDCGNRIKARRHYRKKKTGKAHEDQESQKRDTRH